MCVGIICTQLLLRSRTHLTLTQLELNLEPTAHSARHALLHMVPKWSSHWTTRAGLQARFIYTRTFTRITWSHAHTKSQWRVIGQDWNNTSKNDNDNGSQSANDQHHLQAQQLACFSRNKLQTSMTLKLSANIILQSMHKCYLDANYWFV